MTFQLGLPKFCESVIPAGWHILLLVVKENLTSFLSSRFSVESPKAFRRVELGLRRRKGQDLIQIFWWVQRGEEEGLGTGTSLLWGLNHSSREWLPITEYIHTRCCARN